MLAKIENLLKGYPAILTVVKFTILLLILLFLNIIATSLLIVILRIAR